MENEKKSIHEIFKAAFKEVEDTHNIRVEGAKFDFMRMVDGSTEIINIKFEVETIK